MVILAIAIVAPFVIWLGQFIYLNIDYFYQEFVGQFNQPHPAEQAQAVVAVTPTPKNTPTVPLSPSPVPRALVKHLSEKLFMQDLINQERKKAGVPLVGLGDNVAAQLHAEDSLANCFSSHWGLNGLKPYMRYSLAGGYQSNAENGSGSDYCIKEDDGYAPIRSVQQKLTEMMDGLMSSPGHRRNILDKSHKKVNIGLAWDQYNLKLYQHFEGDYVEYDQLPVIENDRLSFSGSVKNGAKFDEKEDLGVLIFYDPPPGELTRGQISRTYCYDPGLPVAALRPRINPGRSYSEHIFSMTYSTCPDPYEVPKDAPAADSPSEATELWGEAYYTSEFQTEQEITGPWINSSNWTAQGTHFSVSAYIRQTLIRHGNGVYTIVIKGNIDGEDTIISQYSIFHEVTPPDIRSLPVPTPESINAVVNTVTLTPANTRTPIVAVAPVATPTAATSTSSPTVTPVTPTLTPARTPRPIPTQPPKIHRTVTVMDAGESTPTRTVTPTPIVTPTSTIISTPTQTATPTYSNPDTQVWQTYRNDSYGYSIAIAPGWSLTDEDDEGSSQFHNSGYPDQAMVLVQSADIGQNATLKEFADVWLSGIKDWEKNYHMFEITSLQEREDKDRTYYKFEFRAQGHLDSCITGAVVRTFLSDSYPSLPYGFAVIGLVCEDSQYHEERDVMLDSFDPSAMDTQTPTFTPTQVPELTSTSTSTLVPTDIPTPTLTLTPAPAGASRDNPVPLGKPGTTHDDFEIWIVEVQKDAHEIVVEANKDNYRYEAPPSGHIHIIVRIRVKNLSVEPQKLFPLYDLGVVGPSQLEFQQCQSSPGYLLDVPDDYDYGRLMFQGGEIEGNLCYTVKESDLDSLVMFHEGGSGWTFFALQ